MVSTCLLILGTYLIVSLTVPNGPGLTAFGDVTQCMVALFATAGLLSNAGSRYRRQNAFWTLMALGCAIWMAGQLVWTYHELVAREPVPSPSIADSFYFLHTVPMIAALAVRPHARQVGESLRYGYLDLLLLVFWWLYVYLFVLIPYGYIAQDLARYGQGLIALYLTENLILLCGLGTLWLKTMGAWRRIFMHLFGATALHTLANVLITRATQLGRYHTGSLYDLPLVGAFVWFATAGIIAYRRSPPQEPVREGQPVLSGWPTTLAMAGVLSMPLFITWNSFLSDAPPEIHRFRLLVTLLGIVVGTALVFLRQYRVERDRLRLLEASQASLASLGRLQAQCTQSEKLASLAQLAARAAHDINNPLTAILGYSDLLVDDPEAGETTRSVADKIRAQGWRTRSLVNNLLSFARQVPAQKTLLNLNSVLASAIELRASELGEKNIRVELDRESDLPPVQADSNQLLQAFHHIISNAMDAMEEMGGGTLGIRTRRLGTNVTIEFNDTGPGVRNPRMVFDPFYTTKPVGRGTGLGLSICYGIVKEHGGNISCRNRPQGGAAFTVELPGAPIPSPAGRAMTPERKID